MMAAPGKDHKQDCFVCGEEIIYFSEREKLQCYYCRDVVMADSQCRAGHFVCDKCHSSSAMVLIERYCIRTQYPDPLKMAVELMHSSSVKMHGAEHHLLVPATLLAAYYNYLVKKGHPEKISEKEKKIREARLRAEKVSSGFCGFYGTCGAAIGAGIFISLVSGATPVSVQEWKLSNTITSRCLHSIACAGGPRCCKRDTFLAIQETIPFVNKHFDVEIPLDADIRCQFSQYNRECLKDACQFFDR